MECMPLKGMSAQPLESDRNIERVISIRLRTSLLIETGLLIVCVEAVNSRNLANQ